MRVPIYNTDKVAIIDDEDYHLVRNKRWCLLKTGSKELPLFYARHVFSLQGKFVTILLHRLVMGVKIGQNIDHRNHDGLDCRKNNLQFAMHAENNINRRKNAKNTLYKGVKQAGNKFSARLGKKLLGVYDSLAEAAEAYNKEAKSQYSGYIPELLQ